MTFIQNIIQNLTYYLIEYSESLFCSGGGGGDVVVGGGGCYEAFDLLLE